MRTCVQNLALAWDRSPKSLPPFLIQLFQGIVQQKDRGSLPPLPEQSQFGKADR
jgi:hypothetical protein